MVTCNKIADKSNNNYLELYGLSTDVKPTDTVDNLKIKNGSTFYEMNTKRCFIFSEENATWYPM